MTNEKEENKNISKVILWVMFVISIIVSILILIQNNKPEEYKLLFIMPLIFAVIVLAFLSLKKNITNSVVKLILFCGYFLRATITPFIMMIGDYSSKVTNMSIFENMDNAIILICYEMIIVFSVLFVSKSDKSNEIIKAKYKDFEINAKRLFFCIGALGVLAIVLIVLYPSLKNLYGFFIFYNLEEITLHDNIISNLVETLPPLVYPIFRLVVDILRELIPIFLIILIKNKLKKKEGIAIILSIAIVIFSLIFMSDDKAVSVYLAIGLILIIGYLYPNYIKKIIKATVVMGIILAIIIFTADNAKSEKQNVTNQLSDTLQAYFEGPANVSVALNLTPFNLQRLPIDTGKSITIVAYFFRSYESIAYIFNAEYHGISGRTNQIIPLIGQGYYYFGYLLAPLLHGIIIMLALYMEKRVNKTESIFNKYIFLMACIILSITPIAYNWAILVNLFTSLIIPILIIGKICVKKSGDENGTYE